MGKYEELERKAFGDNEKYWEYRRKWIENPNNHIVDNAPLNIDIEITNVCNLQCPMCPRTISIKNDNEEFKQGFMSFSLYKKIIDEAAELGVPAVKLIWRGEPTLHKELPEFVKYAKDKGIIDVLINTNGLLLTEALSRRLIDAGLDKIIFSVDSAKEETYSKIRIGSDFKTVVENIKTLKRLKEELGTVKPLTFASMIKTEINYDEESEFISFFDELVDNVFANSYHQVDWAKIDTRLKSENVICEQLWQRITIDWSGMSVPCCYDTGFNYVLGEYGGNSIYDIWHGGKLTAMRRLHAGGKSSEIEVCRMCVNSRYVTGE